VAGTGSREAPLPGFEGLVGQSAAMQALFRRLARLAVVDVSVLILGESGTGKELVAAALHRLSPRRGARFEPINCGGLSRELLRSELFGHERGAFTGAVERQAGLLREADGGTVFLDEVGELPLDAQAVLLRFVPSIYSVRLVNVELSAGLIDDGRHDHPHPHGLLRGVRTQRSLVFENLALRHQLAVLQRTARRPRLRTADRLLWVLLSRMWSGWMDAISVVQPATVIRWQRTGFKLVWTWRSRRSGPGRPAVAPEVRVLIRQMSRANPLWGAPRIHGELQKLGIEISQAAVSKYVVRHRKPPSQTWRPFLENHLGSLVSVDFFVVPTVLFKVLFVFVVLAHDRRRVVHVNVTDAPTAQWTAQQLVEAFPWETTPRYVLRDRDAVYGVTFSSRARTMGIHEVKTAPRSPWQNPYVERFIGTLRRECLDHVVVLNETHLRRLLSAYLIYYHRARTHLSLAKDAPEPRPVERLDEGRIVETPMVGGLHHRYGRRAA
jgi:putative transposase